MTSAIGASAQPELPSSKVREATTLERLRAARRQYDPARPVGVEKRAAAFAKLLEGQRFLWLVNNARRSRTQSMSAQNALRARTAFVQAVEFDPSLAEAYFAIAELSITIPPGDIDAAIEIAGMAIEVDRDNFSAHRLLARLCTFKSGLGVGSLDSVFATRAIEQWQTVVRLDPRNAEGWAFLSEFFERQGKTDERIQALRKWVSSASPLDSQFYQRVTSGRRNLSSETATALLGEALIQSKRSREAIETLAPLVADDPNNEGAIGLLREAIDSAKPEDLAAAIDGLRQAVGTDPSNLALASLLAEVYARSGQIGDSAALLNSAAERLSGKDPAAAAEMLANLADIYQRHRFYQKSIETFRRAIELRRRAPRVDVDPNAEKRFLAYAFERMIQAAKAEGLFDEAKAIIEQSRKYLGSDSELPNRNLIKLYRETGRGKEALSLVRTVRGKSPLDESLARLEATILTELGRVDEGVASFRRHIAARNTAAGSATAKTRGKQQTVTISPASVDEFSDYLFISQLYSQANRGKEAIAAASQAAAVAGGPERRQIAKITLATAQQMSGDFAGAEITLRQILLESPGNPIALNNLGYFLLERNERFEEALEMIKKAVESDPTNPSFLDSLGWAYFKLGKLEEAEKYLRNAIGFDSSSATIHEHLGDVLEKLGKTAQAKTHWKRALELSTDAKDVRRIRSKLK
ncbi:MAG: hypothetical protein C4324_06000 [Blastocatellia bacterium]